MDAKNRLLESEKLLHLMSFFIAKLLIHPELIPVFMKAFEMKPQGESSEGPKDASYADSLRLVQVAMGVQSVFSPSEYDYASPIRERLVRAYYDVINAGVGVGVGSSMTISQVEKIMEKEDADVDFEPAALDQVTREYQNILMGV